MTATPNPAPIDAGRAAAWAELEAMRPTCAGRNGGDATMTAVAHCMSHRLDIPDWLAGAYLRRSAVVRNCEVLSWDDPEAFGRPWPKGTRQQAERRNIQARKRVHAATWAVLQADPSRPLRRPLFDEVGLSLQMSGASAERRYREAVKTGALDLAKSRASLASTTGQSSVFCGLLRTALLLNGAPPR